MKSRLLPAMTTLHPRRPWRLFWLVAIVLVGMAATAAAFAQDEEDPPGRVGHVSWRQGGVVFAPYGEDEWTELPQNRPISAGDRLWTDRAARAELQVGTSTMHLDGESHLGVSELEDRALKVILQQGSVNLRVREVAQGENVEVDTPNLALRALQPGDYRIDVDTRSGETRVAVQSGLASVFGEGGESIHLGAGQNATFTGRLLAQVRGQPWQQDDFAAWAADRNRAEDHSLAARYVPRGVVGYPQLDGYGNWSQDPSLGAVWYPTVQMANWAPYRYGHWSWISPWGWTWIDDAPWGFAPFHYGRWTMIGTRWAWVPGRLAQRPVYAPALVVFLGGGSARLAINSGPAVGWYPLAPGEAWWPVFRHSPRYVGFANFNINLNQHPRHSINHLWRTRPHALTAVAEDDFRRGRPVYRHWQPLAPQSIGHAQTHVVPTRPDLRHRGEFQRPSSRLHAPPPGNAQSVQPGQPRFFGGREMAPAVREQYRAQREQDRLQRDAERAARDQQERGQREAWRQQREQRHDRDGNPPVRPFVQQARPFAQPAPQAVPVPQQQVQPVQQPPWRGRGEGRGNGGGRGDDSERSWRGVQGQGGQGGWGGQGGQGGQGGRGGQGGQGGWGGQGGQGGWDGQGGQGGQGGGRHWR
jgi:hypothetical protein